MIDNSTLARVSTSGITTRKARISENTGAVFSILTESVYSFPRVAGVREIISNALDATTRAKSTTPIEIKRPSNLDMIFSVRDFGGGLTYDEIFDLYTSLGSSSKTKVENEVGFFGIGALSPLAYVESFTVQSFRDGVCSLYTIMLGEDGVPDVAPIGESKTDKPDGLCVSYIVKRNEIVNFNDDITNTLKYIPGVRYKVGAPPTYYMDDILNSKDLSLSFDNYIFVTKRGYYTSGQKNTLVMGGVAYEFDTAFADKNNFFSTHVLIIEAPIGAVSVQASREKLKLNTKTMAYIKGVIDYIFSNAEKETQKQIDGAGTFMQALKVFESQTICKIKDMKWKGQELKYQTLLDAAEKVFKIKYKRGKIFTDYSKNDYRFTNLSTGTVVYLDDTKRGGLSRITTASYGYSLVFIQKTSKETEDFVAEFGDIFVQRASAIPAPVRIKSGIAKSKKKVYIFKSTLTHPWNYSPTFNNSVDEFTGDYDKFDGYYVFSKNRSIIYGAENFPISHIYNNRAFIKGDIIVIDWESKPPAKAKSFLDHVEATYEGEITNFHKKQTYSKIKSDSKLSFICGLRKDLEEEVKNLDVKCNIDNYDALIDLVKQLKKTMPTIKSINDYKTLIVEIITKHYPIMEVLTYQAYHEPYCKHLENYLKQGNQNVFKGCLGI